MKVNRRITYYFASLLNLLEAVLLSLYCARNCAKDSPAVLFILAASVSFSFCVSCLEETFFSLFSLKNISGPELSSHITHITKKGFLQVQGFYLLHSCVFCLICFYIGNAKWIAVSITKEIILWCFAYPCTRT